MENNNATLVEAKKAYTNQLVSLITPQIYEGIKDLYDCAKKNMKGKNIRHSFQIELQAVSLWNQIIIENETERIIANTNCNYLDKLVTVIFINSTKILAAAYIGFNETHTLEISVPKLSHFIHRVYIETAKEFYKNPYLLDDNLRPRERQDNLRSSIESIKFGIEQAILRLLPIGEILSRDINKQMPEIENNLQPKLEDIKEDYEEDIEENLNDTENDAENDSENDAENYTENDVENDAENDTENDTENDVENDAENDVKNDAENDTENDTENDVKNDAENDTENDAENDTENDAVNDVKNENFNDDGVNLSDYDDSMDEDISEENFVTEQISNTGSEEDGINVEEINENNKEFIEEKKNDPNLVDDIIEEINLKNIDLKESNERQTSNDIIVNRVDEEADLNNINFSVGKNKEETEIEVTQEENSVNKLPEEQVSIEQELKTSVQENSSSVNKLPEEQVSIEQELKTSVQENSSSVKENENLLQVSQQSDKNIEAEGIVVEEDKNSSQLLDTIPIEKEEKNIEIVSTPLSETENFKETVCTSKNELFEGEDLRNELDKNNYMKESNNMLKTMKDELRRSKTVYVNPYRSKRNNNSKRLERLRNVRIKKRQNSQEDLY